MATRFYLPASGTAPLGSLAYDSNWELTTSAVRRPCSTSKSNTSLTDTNLTWGSTTTQQWVWYQFQTGLLAQGYSWTTSDTVSVVVRCLEGSNQNDSHLAYSVRVVSNDGSTVRGTVGLYHATSTEFPTTNAATRIHNARTDGASNFTSYPGDRIIIEIGLHGVTPATSASNTMRMGDPSATDDFALTAGLTTDLCPWVELSRDVIFGNARMTAAITTGGANTVSGTMWGYGKQYILGSAAGGGANTVSGNLTPRASIGYMSNLVLGSELFTYNTFDAQGDWHIYTPAAVSVTGGVAVLTNAEGDGVDRSSLLTIGHKYRIVFEVKTRTSGWVQFWDGVDIYGVSRTSPGVYSEIFTAANDDIFIIGVTNCNATFDNAYIKEVTGNNGQGVATVSGTLTEHSEGSTEYIAGSAAGGGANTVSGTLNGKVSLSSITLGSNVVINGGFDTDTDWTGSAVIANGVCHFDTSNQKYQGVLGGISFVRVLFEIKNLVFGLLFYSTRDGSVSFTLSSNGFYQRQYRPFNVNLNLWTQSNPGQSFDLDNVSAYSVTFICNGISTVSGTLTAKGKLIGYTPGSELVVNNTFDTDTWWSKDDAGVTISDGVAHYVGIYGGGGIYAGIITTGHLYKTVFQIVNYVSGVIRINNFTTPSYTSNGIYTLVLRGSGYAANRFQICSIVSVTADIDNVYVHEITNQVAGVASVSGTLKGKGELRNYVLGSEIITNGAFDTDMDWQYGLSWSIHDGRAYSDGTDPGGSLNQGENIGVSRYDRVIFEADVVHSSGSLRLRLVDNLSIAETKHWRLKLTITAVWYSYFITTWTAWTGSIDNISVKKITQSANGIALVSGTLTASGGAETAVGSSAGVSTVSGTLRATGQLYTSSSGVALVAGILQGIGSLTGAISSSSSVSGVLLGQGFGLGSTGGIASVSATLTAKGTLLSTSTGFSTVSGNLVGRGQLQGSTSGVTTDTATVLATGQLVGTQTGASLVTGVLLAKGSLVASSVGGSSISGTIYNATPFTSAVGVSTGISAVSASLFAKGQLYGSSNGVAAASSTLVGRGSLTGAISSQTLVSGVLLGQSSFVGLISGIALVSATLVAKGQLRGTIAGVSAVSGFIPGEDSLYGLCTGISAVSGTLIARGALQATTGGVTACTGVLQGMGTLAAITTGVSTITATGSRKGVLTAYIICTPVVSATLTATGRLVGAIAGTSSVIAFTTSDGAVAGAASGTSVVSATLLGKGRAVTQISGTALVGGTLGAEGDLTAAILSTSSVIGLLQGTGLLQGQTDGNTSIDATGRIYFEGQLVGLVEGQANVLATLLGMGVLQGQTTGTASVSAYSQLRWLHEKLERNSYITSVFSATSSIATTMSGQSEIRALTESWNSIIKDDDE